MRATRIPADEQCRLLMEYRARGQTDYEWCLQHDNKTGTFYNWVKRSRKTDCSEIPNAASHHQSPRHQEVVKIKLTLPDKAAGNLIRSFQEPKPCQELDGIMELSSEHKFLWHIVTRYDKLYS